MSQEKSKTELIVALDVASAQAANAAVQALSGLDLIYKVGLELFCAVGPEFVRSLAASGHRVFLDLKFHDIPNTVAKAATQAAQLGVEMFTYHLASGPVAIQALHQAIDQEAHKRGTPVPLALGVSVLTSFDEDSWGSVTLALCNTAKARDTLNLVTPTQSVEGLFRVAEEWGVRGVVCSPLELELASKMIPETKTVVPGIRPPGSAQQDQARVMTPSEAAQAGAYAIVVGRPILGAKDPRQAAEEILCAIKG